MNRTSVPVVPAGRTAAPARPAPGAAYLRDTRSGVIASRPAVLRPHRDEIRIAWKRSAALAMELIQNSGRLRGAANQIIADTVGAELQLNPQPDPGVMGRLGYDSVELARFIRDVKARWKRWAWNPAECDYRGKLTVPQMVDVGLRWELAFGEVTGNVDYMPRGWRAGRGVATGTKVTMVPPLRLVQDTNEAERMFQGVIHDADWRPIAYRVEELDILKRRQTRDWRARDDRGRTLFMHIFEPQDADDVRGISVLASAFRKYIQHEILDDVTLQTAVLQTIYAAVITSELPSREAFEGLEQIRQSGKGEDVADDLIAMIGAQMDRAREARINVSDEPIVSHLGPGERFDIKNAMTPHSEYLPFTKGLSRDAARALGISYAGLTMDFEGATYSSTRMENSSIWPVTTRRRERIAGVQCQTVYEAWLDEEIGEGRLGFKGGYAAFRANRDAVTWAQWQGPAKPTADDQKSARAASERLANGTSSLEIEAAELGHDAEELFEQRVREHQRYVEAGMVSPYDRRPGSSGSASSDDRREDDEEEREEREEREAEGGATP